MAITIPATGSGTQNPPVATEVIAGEHYQFFKLVDGNVGSASTVGTSANPLQVALPGVEAIVGSVGATQLGAWTFIGSATTQSSITAFQGAAPWTVMGSVYATGSVNATIIAGSLNATVAAGSLNATAFGNIAHDTADAGNPVKIGGFAATSSFPTAVDSGDRVNALFDKVGRQIVMPFGPLGLSQNKHNDFTGPLSGTIVWTPGIANRVCVTDLRVMVGSATGGIVTVYFARSGAPINFTVGSGVCLFRGEMAPSTTVKPGAVMQFPYPTVGDANDALRISITTTMQVYVMAGGFEAP